VNWATTASGATAPSDFLPGSGTLVFAPGDNSEELVVRLVGDTTQEAAEAYFITLTAPTNGTIVGTSGAGWIVDDDASEIYANDVTVTEGTGATPTEATFTVTRFGSTDGTTQVQYNAINSTTQAADYVPTNGTLTFAPGETSKEVTVPVTADALQEVSEVFLLDLTGAQNGTVVGSRGTARIIDDDTSHVGLTGVTVDEGNGGTPRRCSR
jgi:chitinase